MTGSIRTPPTPTSFDPTYALARARRPAASSSADAGAPGGASRIAHRASRITHGQIRPTDRVLVIGCGTSTLSEQLYQDGYRDVCNVDYSAVVIRKMAQVRGSRRPPGCGGGVLTRARTLRTRTRRPAACSVRATCRP